MKTQILPAGRIVTKIYDEFDATIYCKIHASNGKKRIIIEGILEVTDSGFIKPAQKDKQLIRKLEILMYADDCAHVNAGDKCVFYMESTERIKDDIKYQIVNIVAVNPIPFK